MLSAAEKKLILVGSAAVVALSAVCTGVLIAVKGDKPAAVETAVVEEPQRVEFPMQYFQRDRRNYISEDGNLVVIGPAFDKPRHIEDGKTVYPIVVLHKRGEEFLDPYILWGEHKGAKEGNFTLAWGNMMLSDEKSDITFTYNDGNEKITVKLLLVSGDEE